jgi:hypothetical protein
VPSGQDGKHTPAVKFSFLRSYYHSRTPQVLSSLSLGVITAAFWLALIQPYPQIKLIKSFSVVPVPVHSFLLLLLVNWKNTQYGTIMMMNAGQTCALLRHPFKIYIIYSELGVHFVKYAPPYSILGVCAISHKFTILCSLFHSYSHPIAAKYLSSRSHDQIWLNQDRAFVRWLHFRAIVVILLFSIIKGSFQTRSM